MIEQLNLAQTVLVAEARRAAAVAAVGLEPVPVIEAAREANIPTIIIDDARTDGASTYVGTDQVSIGAKAAAFLSELYPDGGKVAQIEGAAGSPNARMRIQGFKEELAKYPTSSWSPASPATGTG